ncbi:MAG TPA: NrtA/SsuA/CpmA family ABC transporter substrate-binding protein [Geobacteraceae bacterium]|nr:NrtA/SsuA/CpmA family ABC transporter substrate-binding protein [Geobacteraceae bacterium]
MRSILLVLLISGGFFSLLSCEPMQKQSGPREKLTIAYSTASNAVLVYIAFAKGYFWEEGLDAIPQPHPFGKPALTAVIEGKADIATVGDTPIVFAVMNGEKIMTLAAIQTSNKDEAIVARRDRGITKPADLKGKKIGVPFGTTAHFFIDSFLLAHGLVMEKVTLVDMKPAEMAVALENGRVDAVSVFNPTVKQLEKHLGENGVLFYSESLYKTFCVTATQEFVKKNPEAIKKFLRALIKSETFIKEHPKEAQNLVADFIKMDKTELADIWNILTFRVTLDQALLVDFEDQTRWILKNRLSNATRMPNYLEYIHTDGLDAVKPIAVRIVR